jgi:hypothetical protein
LRLIRLAGILASMTTTAADDRVTSYNPVVPTTDFPADFPVFSLDDLAVFVDEVERFDFTVSGTFTDGISTNAKAVFSPGVTGAVLVVGARDPHRTNSFNAGAPVPTRDQNLALDTLEAEMQETSRDVERAVKVAPGSTGYQIASGIANGRLLIMNNDMIDEGPDFSTVDASIDEAIAAAAAAAGSAAAAATSEANAAASANASLNAVDDAQAAADEAVELVQQATAGFVGFLDGQGYDFGLVSDSTTYFNQDWGTL